MASAKAGGAPLVVAVDLPLFARLVRRWAQSHLEQPQSQRGGAAGAGVDALNINGFQRFGRN